MVRVQRTQDCSQRDAENRLRHAEAFLEVADLVSNENDPHDEFSSVAASLAVLAGIAAADAVCCGALKERSRSADHRDAVALVEGISPDGKVGAKNLKILIDLKDSAQHGLISVTAPEVKRAFRHAEQLVALASAVVHR